MLSPFALYLVTFRDKPVCLGIVTGTLKKRWKTLCPAFSLPHSAVNGERDFPVKGQDASPVSFLLPKVASLHSEYKAPLLLALEPCLGSSCAAVQVWLKETSMCLVLWPLKQRDVF